MANLSKAEQARLERIKLTEQQKKDKQKRKKNTITIVVVSIIVALLIIGVVLVAVLTPDDTIAGTYILSDMNVKLKTNKSFTATLAHETTYNGTYKVDGDEIIFTYDDTKATGTLIDNKLTIPHEWDDGHGHITGDFVRSYAGTYALDDMSIVLTGNAFTASLSHGTTYSGTYTIDGTEIQFSYSGQTATGKIVGDEINIPHIWDDGHGHITGAFVKED